MKNKNKIELTLEGKTVESLNEIFKEDYESMRKFILKTIDDELKKYADEKNTPKNNADGLEDYLKSGNTGSRDYGIKGQGW
ncbi:MAG: hypothetical protein ACQ9MH_01595 [Nitrospinales bacterium]